MRAPYTIALCAFSFLVGLGVNAFGMKLPPGVYPKGDVDLPLPGTNCSDPIVRGKPQACLSPQPYAISTYAPALPLSSSCKVPPPWPAASIKNSTYPIAGTINISAHKSAFFIDSSRATPTFNIYMERCFPEADGKPHVHAQLLTFDLPKGTTVNPFYKSWRY